VDSSEPALNFLGRREFMAKWRREQVPLVCDLLGGRIEGDFEDSRGSYACSPVYSGENYGPSFQRNSGWKLNSCRKPANQHYSGRVHPTLVLVKSFFVKKYCQVTE
jgi:hypothetical protein